MVLLTYFHGVMAHLYRNIMPENGLLFVNRNGSDRLAIDIYLTILINIYGLASTLSLVPRRPTHYADIVRLELICLLKPRLDYVITRSWPTS